jgi:3'(2'), 5'-bisphosphate nucleotidase
MSAAGKDSKGFATMAGPEGQAEALLKGLSLAMNATLKQNRVGRRLDLSVASRDEIAELFAEIALAAGPIVMAEYSPNCQVRSKSDQSPVTIADERAEALILELLRDRASDTPVIAEESAARGERPEIDGQFILVDPLDGTREFISGNGEFTINIALVRDGVVVVGAVYAPAIGRLWLAGERAFSCDAPVGAPLPALSARRLLKARIAPQEGLVALASRSHSDAPTEAFLAKLPIGERRSAGSSLKFCVLAEGDADVYPRFGPTMEWDTAAGEAILLAAGGAVLSVDGGPLRYGKAASGFRNGGFIAWGDPAAPKRLGHA